MVKEILLPELMVQIEPTKEMLKTILNPVKEKVVLYTLIEIEKKMSVEQETKVHQVDLTISEVEMLNPDLHVRKTNLDQ